MKLPKYFVETPQQCIYLHLNPFALQLMAESFADDPAKFGDENVVFLARAHNGQTVWFVMTKQTPRAEDFDQAPAAPANPAGNYCSICNLHDAWCEHIQPPAAEPAR